MHAAYDIRYMPLCLVYGCMSTQRDPPVVFFYHIKPSSHAPPLGAFITPWAQALPPSLLPGALGFTELYPPDHSPRSASLCYSSLSLLCVDWGSTAVCSCSEPTVQFVQHGSSLGLTIQMNFVGIPQSWPTFMDSLLFFVNNWCPVAARKLHGWFSFFFFFLRFINSLYSYSIFFPGALLHTFSSFFHFHYSLSTSSN